MIVHVDNLVRDFGDFRAVDSVSFSFGRGQVFGFIGPNGAGKTTTLRLLATVDVPTAGDAYIEGHSVVNYPDKIRRHIGYMPDYYGTYASMTVWEYLDFFARAYGLHSRSRTRAIDDVMDFTDLGPLSEKKLDALSKGMKQRVCLGRCLIHDPDVLLLDEPAAGLDPRARIEFRELLRVLAVERNKAILISSHILTEISEICDGVVIIELGKILVAGPVAEIEARLKNGQLATAGTALAAGETTGESAAAGQEIIIRVLGQAADAEKLVLEQPHILRTQRTDSTIAVIHSGSDDDRVQLLHTLVTAGVPVIEFRSEQTNLEDLFMQITTGKVQ